MKVLYINTPECDYLQDATYSGLVKILGKSNVIDYPFNYRFHFPRKKYPRNLGYNSSDLLSRITSKKDDYSLVVLASCNEYSAVNFMKIHKTLKKNVPLVLIDGSDRPEIGGDFKRLKSKYLFDEIDKIRPFDLIFKREYLISEDHEKRVRPFPFAINFDKFPKPAPEKKYDVSFWAVESDPIRTKALTLLENKFDCRANGTTRNQIFRKYKRKGKFYLEELSACKVVLNFRGAGWDTLRYWETPAMQTFMISQKPQFVIPDNFRHGEEVVFCKDDLSDLVDLCDFYLKNDSKREQIASVGYKWAREKHTDVARAQYLLDQVKQII